MVFCTTCNADVEVDNDNIDGFSCCIICGRVVEDVAFTSGVTFAKGADGDGEMVGQYVTGEGSRSVARYSNGRMYAGQSDSHENAVAKGRSEIAQLVEHFRVTPISDNIESAHRFYKLALQRGFTRGRRVNQVAATCLYIVCREERKPFMLIDFSDHLSINLFTLGAVYLQLIKLLRLEDHPTFTKPIDPSLYLHRFADRLKLPREKNAAVISTSLKLVQSMKRDWLQTGRRPSGICGAALFIAAHVHGCGRSKQDIIAVVHIGWNTIEQRVREFAGTASGDMTVDEFQARAREVELEKERFLEAMQRQADERRTAARSLASVPTLTASREAEQAPSLALQLVDGEAGSGGVAERVPGRARQGLGQHPGGGCEHVENGAVHIYNGMCCECLADYLKSTGGVFEGSHDPPAYVNNVRRAVKRNALAVESAYGSDDELGEQDPSAGRVRALHLHDIIEEGTMEAEMDQALYSSELQGIATALAGDQPAAARPFRQGASRGGPLARQGDGDAPSPQDLPLTPTQHQPGTSAAGPPAPSGASSLGAAAEPVPSKRPSTLADTATDANGTRKRVRFEGGVSQDEEDEEVDALGAADALCAEGEDAEGHELVPAGEVVDTLSDVDMDELDCYFCTKEEAEQKDKVWVEMNKDWLEKQAAKAAAAEGAAADGEGGEGGGAAAGKTKRAYVRRQKPLLAANSAAEAAANMLDQKRLSSKINYSKLTDLFETGGAMGADEGGEGGNCNAGEEEEQGEGSGLDTGSAVDVAAIFGLAPSTTTARGKRRGGAGEPATALAAEMQRREERRAAAIAKDDRRYSRQLEAERERRAGLGGLADNFLDSLSFSRPREADGGVVRVRPQGLSTRPRSSTK